jgi:hypothetical protein
MAVLKVNRKTIRLFPSVSWQSIDIRPDRLRRITAQARFVADLAGRGDALARAA